MRLHLKQSCHTAGPDLARSCRCRKVTPVLRFRAGEKLALILREARAPLPVGWGLSSVSSTGVILCSLPPDDTIPLCKHRLSSGEASTLPTGEEKELSVPKKVVAEFPTRAGTHIPAPDGESRDVLQNAECGFGTL